MSFDADAPTRPIPLTTMLLLAATILAAGLIGFLAGRHFPTKHYQRFADTVFLIQTGTGKMCAPAIGKVIEDAKYGLETAPDTLPADFFEKHPDAAMPKSRPTWRGQPVPACGQE